MSAQEYSIQEQNFFLNVEKALIQAGKNARELAKRTGTRCVIGAVTAQEQLHKEQSDTDDMRQSTAKV